MYAFKRLTVICGGGALKRPLQHPSEMGDPLKYIQALNALFYGDEATLQRPSLPYDFPVPDYEDDTGPTESADDAEETMSSLNEYIEDVVTLDEMISEAVGAQPTMTPTPALLEQIVSLKEALRDWFVVPGPRPWRLYLREAISELATIEAALHEGNISIPKAQALVADIHANVSEILSDLNMA